MNFCKFTIQNVPIKLKQKTFAAAQSSDLQYKMFLLNRVRSILEEYPETIYNTKCSY